jgi:Arc-like DNA binding domain
MCRLNQARGNRQMVRKSQELRPVMTRLPEGLRHRLEREAKLNRHSMNAEIISRLESSFRREETNRLILEAIDRTLKALGISNDPRTWSPEMRAWAAQQPGLLGLSQYFPEAQPSENPTESASTDKEEDPK